jgi:hypothetical protein
MPPRRSPRRSGRVGSCRPAPRAGRAPGWRASLVASTHRLRARARSSIPSRRSASPSASPSGAGSRGSSRSAPSTITASPPKCRTTWASSTPADPPAVCGPPALLHSARRARHRPERSRRNHCLSSSLPPPLLVLSRTRRPRCPRLAVSIRDAGGDQRGVLVGSLLPHEMTGVDDDELTVRQTLSEELGVRT